MKCSSGFLAAAGVLFFAVFPMGATRGADIPPMPAVQETGVSSPVSEVAESQMPVSSPEGPLTVTLDKSEIVRLHREIGSIILGNPLPASVLMDTPETLIIVPRTPGATHVTVLGKDGLVLMDRHIIVDAPAPRYLRIRTTCIGKEKNCTPNRSYYCPEGRCAEITMPELSDSKDSSSSADAEKAAMDAAVEDAPTGGVEGQ